MMLAGPVSRRTFVALSAGAPLAFAAGKRVPVGLELFSVREGLMKDLPGTVSAVARMGYEIVEFYDPTDVFGDLADALAEAFPTVAPEAEGGEDEDGDEGEDDGGEDGEDDEGEAEDEDRDEGRAGDDGTGDRDRA